MNEGAARIGQQIHELHFGEIAYNLYCRESRVVDADAPEIDGNVIVTGTGLKVGDFVPVEIEARQEYDLVGLYEPLDSEE